ncbi:hypothetical protein [Caldivirga maquilingensis]|uniref:Uncharacterized protein n=1 Tax=Caldivirga maquilingensis (strain ATCC 700844 / DSM 13496 / JCM 10307 / IC-167) TaxID=397948 RepID=A8MCU8_CALMQ|nr:hypothetical protein [Caldivirga maquilingensis]ABW01604.1 conserved hypothetical protein [Caldivirga maquilingensis IC-167]
MAVRVRVRLRSSGSIEVSTSALVNTGFETERPQVLIPINLAKVLKLWPPIGNAYIVELGTAGGPIREYVIPNSIEITVITADRESRAVTCDAVVSHVEEEVIINDKLSEELGIIILAAGSGRWRFTDDSEGTVRYSETPQYW